MSNLSYFLAGNVIKEEVVKYPASKRMLEPVIDEKTGEPAIDEKTKKTLMKPVDWELTSITSEEDEVIRKNCTRKVQVPGKKNMFTPETDYDKYLGLLAVKCTICPDLNNSELQDSYKVMGADTLLKTMLKPGEYQDYLKKVQEINGFETSMEDLVDEAKN